MTNENFKWHFNFVKQYATRKGYAEIAEDFAADIYFRHPGTTLKNFFLNYIRNAYKDPRYKKSSKPPRHFDDLDKIKFTICDRREKEPDASDILITKKILNILGNMASAMFILKHKWGFDDDEIGELFQVKGSWVKMKNKLSQDKILKSLGVSDLTR